MTLPGNTYADINNHSLLASCFNIRYFQYTFFFLRWLKNHVNNTLEERRICDDVSL